MRTGAILSLLLLLQGCSSKGDSAPGPSAGAHLIFDRQAIEDRERFFDFPYPSDLRLDARGAPRFRFPNPAGKAQVEALADAVGDRHGFPVVPVAYFRFDAPLATRANGDLVAADPSSPFLLIDVEAGTLIPTVAQTLSPDDYLPENVLAVAPRPGFVLQPNRKYAFVVRTTADDAQGKPLAPQDPEQLRDALYAPLLAKLSALGVSTDTVAGATVFTTGDVVADTAAFTDKVIEGRTTPIEALAIDATDGATHERYCELRGTITLPQFQKGVPPYDKDGLFVLGGDGMPIEQRSEKVPITITLPKAPMPEGGYPLVMYFHGSGGDSYEAVDSGPKKTKDGPYEIGTGPSHVVAAHGFAMATSALPISPERVPGASSFDYLNFGNLPALRDNFRQGIIEQRLFMRALSKLTIDPATVSACSGMSLPAGATAYKLDTTPILAMGLSMGGMYTNLVSAVEPQIAAIVPTGAGGFWSYFVEVAAPKGVALRGIAGALLGTAPDPTFLHPTLHLFETAIEAVEPAVYMPRIARNPLPTHPVRSIYEPVGKDDQYFPTVLYDAIALSYRHPQAGDAVWPTMQDVLKLAGLEGLRGYPLTNNLKSLADKPYTGAVVQYEGDGIGDPHVIVFQLDAVKYQYGCFFETFRDRGVATIPPPAPLGTMCP